MHSAATRLAEDPSTMAGWHITEPMTLATDYALGALTLVLSFFLIREGRRLGQKPIVLWGLAYLFTSVGAVTGGTVHGFTEMLDAFTLAALWKTTLYSIGLGSFFLLLGGIFSLFTGPLRGWLALFASAKFAVYAIWMVTHREFRYVLYDYVPSMLLILVMFAWRGRGAGARAARWIVPGVALSFLAAGIQQSGFALHKHFNHNDLYHVIQGVAFYWLYRGGRMLRDCHLPISS